ncbi:DNA translocase FtsK [Megasphaera paucivorans]|uniref:DNA segregation ATPase FtsK/SpoIIIE, S-DNA-T family n=1 Tax=Megasphaera paucivorans TaxID=349095 RepID=A0A1G9TFJ0_9FIRM|nr:DNA translocase FtsK [Megasphaera paucivorans]SDM46450.1 DNA segregation ATPase FtsK/SpoIIIE, S-DNA-T family [Megasphaera paucivorans]
MAQRKISSRTQKLTGKKRGRRTTKKTQGPSLLKYEIMGLVFIFMGLFAAIGIIGIDTGSIGTVIDDVLAYIFGVGRILAALLLVVLGLKYIMLRKAIPVTGNWALGTLLFIMFLGMIHLFFVPEGAEFMPAVMSISGGAIGGLVAVLLRQFFGQAGGFLVLAIGMIVTVMAWKKWSISNSVTTVSVKATEEIQVASQSIHSQWQEHKTQWQENRKKHKIFDLEKVGNCDEVPKMNAALAENSESSEIPVHIINSDQEDSNKEKQVFLQEAIQEIDAEDKTIAMERNTVEEPEKSVSKKVAEGIADIAEKDLEDLKPVEVERQPTAVDLAPEGKLPIPKEKMEKAYILPSISILKPGRLISTAANDEVRTNARILQETLSSFNIDAKIINASKGPAVTRYELEPAAGVKVSKIVHLSDDIALKLAATDIRIEAPIPGKAAIGIEVPNKQVAGVNLRDVLDSEEFKRAAGGVPVGLGKDIAGNSVIADLTKMPHLLVAGSTGSGKSVCINTLIASILFKQRPCDVKLILIDPKVVELSNYNGIPHLMTPVVTDAKKAARVLRWAVREMDNRYHRFAETSTRDIARYNHLHPEEAFPFVVIIIDELADLMMVASTDVEDSICRLAQKARACGMHLVLATQRPSVDVLTGIIKANVPSRISFAVSSQVDSRTILDMSGAEKLLGKGDMLFYPMGASKPLRVQGAFISDSEIDQMVNFIKKQSEPEYDADVQQAQSEEQTEQHTFFEDELMEQAINMVLETGQASASMLQRRFRIGYTRAARLVDTMEAMQIVGPSNGSKARDILMPAEEVQRKFFSGQT